MSFESVMPPYNATDPSASFLNSSCLDFLLIELVPMAFRVTRDLEAAPTDASGTSGGAAAAGGGASADALSSVSHSQGGGTDGGPAPSSADGAAGGSTVRKLDEDEERDAVFYRLETLGYRVGQGLVERYVSFCASSPLLSLSPPSLTIARGGWRYSIGTHTAIGS